LHELGYSKVREYRGGLVDWTEAGGTTESVTDETTAPEPDAAPPPADAHATIPIGPPLAASPDGAVGRGPARLSRMRRLDKSVLDLVQQRSTLQLFLIWLGMILLTGFAYWLGALTGEHGLIEAGRPVTADLSGFASAIYFSFVTATSIGYGDIVPIGIARVVAVAEAITGLLIFGAVVAKFVSHRQDELVSEIHRVTFEDRLDRIETNLHMVISELLSITAMVENSAPLNRVTTRLESAAILFLGELRTTRDLLYQPRLMVEEGVLAAILATLASAMNVLAELLALMPNEFSRSQGLTITLDRLTSLAEEVCGDCVPHSYTPRLVFWMDRIQATAKLIR
jgi:potassium channel LctB